MERTDLGEEELKPVKPVTHPSNIAQLLLTNIEALDKIPTASIQEIDTTTNILLDELETHRLPHTLGYVGIDDPVDGLSAKVIANNRDLRSMVKGATLGVAEERARLEKSYEVVPKDIVELLRKKRWKGSDVERIQEIFGNKTTKTRAERVTFLVNTLKLHGIKGLKTEDCSTFTNMGPSHYANTFTKLGYR
jgi:hypothetical protein